MPRRRKSPPFPSSVSGSGTAPQLGNTFARPATVGALSEELRGMAASLGDADPRAAERLTDLGDSLGSDAGRLHWAEVDLRSAFNSETLSLAYAVRREGGYVPETVDKADKFRNVLVLVPILLTWAALAEAALNYQRFINVNPEELRKPFLLLWQEGFGGMSHWYSPSFSTVAITDAMIILIIIALTLYSHGVRESREESIRKTSNLLQTELDNVLAEATVELAPDRAGRPATLARAVDRLADRFDLASQELLTRIQAEHTRLDAIASRREKELGDFAVFAGGMRSGAEETHRVVAELRMLSKGLQAAVEDMTTEVSLAVDQQRSMGNAVASLEKLTAGVIHSDQAMTRQLSEAAIALTESADRAVSGADSAAQAGRTASEAVRGIAELTSTLAINQTRLEEAMTGQTQANMQLADSLRSGFSGTSSSSKALSDTAQALLQLRDDFSRISDLSQEQAITLARLLSEQTSVSASLSEVARDFSAIGIATSQRQREVTEEVAVLIRRLDALSNTLAHLATGRDQAIPGNLPQDAEPATERAKSPRGSWPQRD